MEGLDKMIPKGCETDAAMLGTEKNKKTRIDNSLWYDDLGLHSYLYTIPGLSSLLCAGPMGNRNRILWPPVSVACDSAHLLAALLRTAKPLPDLHIAPYI